MQHGLQHQANNHGV